MSGSPRTTIPKSGCLKHLDNWTDDVTIWPPVTEQKILDYLIKRPAADSLPSEAYKSVSAFNYLHSGWVDVIYAANDEANELLYLKAKVCPSQSLNNVWHNAWVCCDRLGVVVTAGCDCMAGAGTTCSHAAAILYKIENATFNNLPASSTCTDELCKWNQGTKQSITPAPLSQIDFKKPKIHKLPTKQQLNKNSGSGITSISSEEEYRKQIQSSGLEGLFQEQGTILNIGYSKIKNDTHGPHGVSLEKNCAICYSFYNKFVAFPPELTAQLQILTVAQSDSKLWKEVRSLRITASSAKSVPKREVTDPINFLINHLHPTFTGNAATLHGLESEKYVRDQISKHYKTEVELSGVVICSQYPWLCASPDGFIGNRLLEIKSPMGINLSQFQSSCDKFGARYDHANQHFELVQDDKRGYYLQAQLAMFVTKKDECLFVFYLSTCKTLVDICVKYDDLYTKGHVARLEKFYLTKMLPFLSGLRTVNSIDLVETEAFIAANKF